MAEPEERRTGEKVIFNGCWSNVYPTRLLFLSPPVPDTRNFYLGQGDSPILLTYCGHARMIASKVIIAGTQEGSGCVWIHRAKVGHLDPNHPLPPNMTDSAPCINYATSSLTGLGLHSRR